MKNIIRFAVQLWFNGIIFILFIAGYFFYGLLKTFRKMQQKKIILILFVLLIGMLGAAGALITSHLLPFGNDHHPIEFIVTPKMSLQNIADSLEQLHVIKSSRTFKLWMRYKKMDRSIQAGMVIVSKGDGCIAAGKKLLQAAPIEISLMIPEGLTIEQTAQHISRTLPIDTSVFISLCYDSSFIRSLNLSVPSLEGYLFPETYRFPEKVTEKAIIERMVQSHLKVWNSITVPDSLKTYSHQQFITLASIVEREATLLSEQPHISGVFHNRLRRGYPLGADPTVRFALKKFGGPLRVSELNSNSPYNTRRFAGLPPGPICSPGEGAIKAAVFPLETRDLYFVAKWDGSGEHDFSETNAEHDRKKLAIRRRNKRRLRRKAAGGK